LRNVTTGAGPVPGSSLTKVATLGVLQGHQVEIAASGPQAHEAVEHALALADRRFDEPDDDQLTDVQAMRREVSPTAGALPASPGIAIGPARLLRRAPVAYAVEPNRGPDAEWRALVEAVAEVRRDIERVRVMAAREVGAAEASIFDAHLMLLGDTAMLADVKRRISAGAGAPTAWDAAVNEVEAQWAALEDPYLRARADDVRAVGEQVLRAMTGTVAATVDGEGILVARDLTPADTAQLDRERVHGIVLAYGSPSSHAAILARSRGIPAVVNAGAGVLSIADGATLVIDGSSGELVIDPSAEELERFAGRAAEQGHRAAQQLARAGEPAVTRDSVEIEVAANLGSVGDARVALASGADAAGLVRTEFLFLGRDSAPSVDEQEAEYVAIGEALGGRRITLRTLDVGGDKPLSYIPVPAEANPFLGRRGIRLSLERSDLMSDQLRAICRAARRTPVSVMFPMITSVGELLEARRLLDEAAGPEGRPGGLRIGIMVEVPAAALKIETFLPYLDFVSIGTNDLTQYTLAAERGNPALAALSDALDPGVLQLIAHVCRTANGRVPVGVCGEAASDPVAVGVLLGLGVRELSVGAGSVPAVKAAVRDLDLGVCRTVAEKALGLRDAGEVRQLVTGG
jgi:phosphocarrier protein FPr